MEQRIGFGKRLGAFLLDCFIVWVLAFFGGGFIGGLLGVGAGAVAGTGSDQDAQAAAAALGGMFGAIMGMMVAIALIGLVYFLIEGFTGYTLGKLILGIRVANADGSGAPVGQLLGRYAIKNIGTLMTILTVITGVKALGMLGNIGALIVFGGCFLALGASKQALHDRIVGTAVYPKGAIRPAAA